MPGDLVDLYYEIDGFKFGEGTNWIVQDLEVGAPEIVNTDVRLPRQDGLRFGRDYRAGQQITFEMINIAGTGTDVLDELGQLRTAWLADTVRATPGAVSILSLTRGGRTRRVYGRPRRFAVASERSRFGWVSVIADFQCVDHLFYGDAELAYTVGMAAPSVGGLVGPLVGPIDAESAGEGVHSVFIGGNVPAWPVMRIHGPIVDPSIEVVGQWSAKINVSLASDQWVTIDPTPWNRAVRHRQGGNLAGAFTSDSQRLSQMRLPPGPQQVILRGLDPTGTAKLQMWIREAYNSY